MEQGLSGSTGITGVRVPRGTAPRGRRRGPNTGFREERRFLKGSDLETWCPEVDRGERDLWQEQLAQYADLLQRWSQRMSLVAVGDLPHLGARHLAPALGLRSVLRCLPHARVLDVGSGGGLPAIPLKITMPAMAMTLVEGRRRRCSFLRQVVRTLGLQHVEVLHQRLEWGEPEGSGPRPHPRPPNRRATVPDVAKFGRHTAAISRAVALTPELLRALRPWLQAGAFLLTSLPERVRLGPPPPGLLIRGAACRGGVGDGPVMVHWGVWQV